MNQAKPQAEVSETREKVKVFIVDDSPLMCRAIEKILADDPGIEVMGHALSGQEALLTLSSTPCDVCTLDVHMPGMSGLSVLKHIMIKNPKPTLMVSAFTGDGSRVTFEALRYGAVDFFQKPSRDSGEDMIAQGEVLRQRVKRAARVQVEAARYLRLRPASSPVSSESGAETSDEAVPGLTIINASTGGYVALLSMLPAMKSPPEVPIIVSLGTPSKYLEAFVDYLNTYVPFEVKRAENHEKIEKGKVYIISSEESAGLETRGGDLHLLLGVRSDLWDQEGGIDLLLFSASEHFGSNLLTIFLSGDDMEGVSGAEEVLRNGGKVLVQMPDTCLAPDLPDTISSRSDVDSLSIDDITALIGGWLGKQPENEPGVDEFAAASGD